MSEVQTESENRRGTEKTSTWGQVTESELERLLERKGVPRTSRGSLQRGRRRGKDGGAELVVNGFTCSQAAYATGDKNPLFHDPEYAANSIWGRIMSPPGALAWMDKVSGATDGFTGCHTIWRGCDLEWRRPILVGDELKSVSYLTDARIVDSKFGGGASAIQDYETEVTTMEGDVIGYYRTSWHRFACDPRTWRTSSPACARTGARRCCSSR